MGYLNPPYWLNDKSGLILLDDERYNDGYGGTVRRSTPVKSVEDFIKFVGRDPKSHFLTIKCEWRGRTITMVDCDSVDDSQAALEYLEVKKIDYAAFASSKDKKWFFPGMSFSSVEAAHTFLSRIPGCDPRYLKIAKDRRHFVIRGEAKEDESKLYGMSSSQPTFLYSTVKDPAVKAFVEGIRGHFESLALKMVTRYRLTGLGWPMKGFYGAWTQEQEQAFLEDIVRSGDMSSTYRTLEETRWGARNIITGESISDLDFMEALRKM